MTDGRKTSLRRSPEREGAAMPLPLREDFDLNQDSIELLGFAGGAASYLKRPGGHAGVCRCTAHVAAFAARETKDFKRITFPTWGEAFG